ncbi:hypothetical protein JOB18_037096 [Solea senegalensis]|uniref:Uncharacterized protein n=1 Tax=Solea senegalensis TaxID=28829 RepID=A0AAV6S281_SOLSE|nr:hypothetical protein JOB18_037096 [Solea senegalensis]
MSREDGNHKLPGINGVQGVMVQETRPLQRCSRGKQTFHALTLQLTNVSKFIDGAKARNSTRRASGYTGNCLTEAERGRGLARLNRAQKRTDWRSRGDPSVTGREWASQCHPGPGELLRMESQTLWGRSRSHLLLERFLCIISHLFKREEVFYTKEKSTSKLDAERDEDEEEEEEEEAVVLDVDLAPGGGLNLVIIYTSISFLNIRSSRLDLDSCLSLLLLLWGEAARVEGGEDGECDSTNTHHTDTERSDERLSPKRQSTEDGGGDRGRGAL